MFSHLLRPPTAVSPRAGAGEGVALGVAAAPGVLGAPALGVPEGAALGVSEGEVLGAGEGAALGAFDGATLGACDGAVLGAFVDCADAAPVMARVAITLRSLRIMCFSSWNWSGCMAGRVAAAPQPLQRFLQRRK